MAKAAKKAAEATSVYDEIVQAVKDNNEDFSGKGRKETDQTYLRGLVRRVYELPEGVWNKLSADAQKWYDDAAAAVKDGDEIELPDGYPEEASAAEEIGEKANRKARTQEASAERKRRAAPPPDEDDEATEDGESEGEGDDGEEEEAAAKPARRAAPARKPAKQEAKAGKKPSNGRAAGSGRQVNPNSSVSRLRKYIIQHPEHTVRQIADWATKQNMEVADGTISTTRVGILHTINIARDLGKWVD